jgi:hypothetical protein
MWQAPNQRVRALQSAKKRQIDRLSRPLHLKRVRAEVRINATQSAPQKIAEARVLLNDVSPTGMGIFSTIPFLVGQEVAITLEDPKRVFLRGRVTWCQEYDVDSHILSANSFSYRMGIKFVFQSKVEEEAVRLFCEELCQNVLYTDDAA